MLFRKEEENEKHNESKSTWFEVISYSTLYYSYALTFCLGREDERKELRKEYERGDGGTRKLINFSIFWKCWEEAEGKDKEEKGDEADGKEEQEQEHQNKDIKIKTEMVKILGARTKKTKTKTRKRRRSKKRSES